MESVQAYLDHWDNDLITALALRSYDGFVDTIVDIVQSMPIVVLKSDLVVTARVLPRLLARVPESAERALLHDRTWATEVLGDIEVAVARGDAEVWSHRYEAQVLFRLPLMTGSRTARAVCGSAVRLGAQSVAHPPSRDDSGDHAARGYFIVDGHERVLVAQEHTTPNVMHVEGGGDEAVGRMTCISDDDYFPKRHVFAMTDGVLTAEVRGRFGPLNAALLARCLGLGADADLAALVALADRGGSPRARVDEALEATFADAWSRSPEPGPGPALRALAHESGLPEPVLRLHIEDSFLCHASDRKDKLVAGGRAGRADGAGNHEGRLPAPAREDGRGST